MLTAHTTRLLQAAINASTQWVSSSKISTRSGVGRQWPGAAATIDASGTLPDGTEIKNAIEFKAWLVDNIDLFSKCLAEKLMTYATGRLPNYAEKREIEEIVKENSKNRNGFRDLVLALIESETFRTQ